MHPDERETYSPPTGQPQLPKGDECDFEDDSVADEDGSVDKGTVRDVRVSNGIKHEGPIRDIGELFEQPDEPEQHVLMELELPERDAAHR